MATLSDIVLIQEVGQLVFLVDGSTVVFYSIAVVTSDHDTTYDLRPNRFGPTRRH